MPKPELDRQLRSPERGRREAAWRAREAAWGARRAELDDALDGLWRPGGAGWRRPPGRRTSGPTTGAAAGRLDYAPEECLVLHEAVEAEVVPLAARRWEARRAALGVATLRPWDLLAAPWRREPAPAFASGDAFVAGVAPVLAALDPELGALYARMGAAGSLDVGWAPGKRGGGTERPYPRTGLPFVRVGEAGTETGTGTLLHEMGHAFHDHLTMTRDGGCLAWDLEHPDEFSELAAFALYFQAAPLLGRPGVGPWPAATAAGALADFLEETLIATLPAFTLADAFQHWAYAEAPAGAGPADGGRRLAGADGALHALGGLVGAGGGARRRLAAVLVALPAALLRPGLRGGHGRGAAGVAGGAARPSGGVARVTARRSPWGAPAPCPTSSRRSARAGRSPARALGEVVALLEATLGPA